MTHDGDSKICTCRSCGHRNFSVYMTSAGHCRKCQDRIDNYKRTTKQGIRRAAKNGDTAKLNKLLEEL